MSKNAIKITGAIKSLVNEPYEVISGTVVPGSLDMARYTISVQPSDSGAVINEVMLNTITESGNGMILVPADSSNIIIASVDGPGEWTLMKASELTRAIIKIGNVTFEMDSGQVNIQSGNVIFNVTDSIFKMNSTTESLYQLLKDCFTYITELTVPTPSGTSSTPVNSVDFNNLITRLDNLLTS